MEIEFNKDKLSHLEQAIRQLDDYFFRSRDIELYKFILSSIEKPLIERTLEQTDGNQLKAAKILGINRNTLHAKIRKLGIEVEKWKRF